MRTVNYIIILGIVVLASCNQAKKENSVVTYLFSAAPRTGIQQCANGHSSLRKPLSSFRTAQSACPLPTIKNADKNLKS